MNKRYFLFLIIIVCFVLYGARGLLIINKAEGGNLTLPSLPKPIAREYALITSAGQGTDTYIINDIANKLMIHNYFMPQATAEDLDGISTLVFVVDYSSMGEKLHSVTYEDEVNRVRELIDRCREEELTVIAVYIGGKQRRGHRTDELLRLVASRTDYLIGTTEADYDGFLSELTKSSRIPLTLIDEVSGLSEPFASAFR